MRTAVLLPCYNESQTIGKVIADFRKELPDADIYVYDNNSTDGSAEISERSGGVAVRRALTGSTCPPDTKAGLTPDTNKHEKPTPVSIS